MSTDVHGYPWISMDIHGYPCMSMDVDANPWTSIDIDGLRQGIHRYIYIYIFSYELVKGVELRGD